jgi:GT2 family glycosyltransferase
MKISCVVCTASRPDAVSRCLESIRAQTLPAGEVIIVYGGPDKTMRDELAAMAPEARLIWWPNPPFGCCHNFSMGLASAVNEWAAIIDDDAHLPPDWLESLARAVEAEPPGTAIFTTKFIERDIAALERESAGYDQEGYLCSFVEGASLYRREAMAAIGFFDPKLVCYAVCRHVSAQLLNRGFRIKYLPSVRTFHDKDYGYRPSGFSISCHVRNWALYVVRFYSVKSMLLTAWDILGKRFRKQRPQDVSSIDVSSHRLGHFGKSIRETPRGWLHVLAGVCLAVWNLPWALKHRRVCRHPDFKTFFGRTQA